MNTALCENGAGVPQVYGSRTGWPSSLSRWRNPPFLYKSRCPRGLSQGTEAAEGNTGAKLGKEKVKLSPLADDMILYTENPEEVTQKLLRSGKLVKPRFRIQGHYIKAQGHYIKVDSKPGMMMSLGSIHSTTLTKHSSGLFMPAGRRGRQEEENFKGSLATH